MGYQEKVIEHHNKYAKGYDSKIEWKYDLLKKYCNKNSVILDIGCGTGNYSIPLSSYVKQVDGIDITQSMLNEMNRKIRIMDIKNITVYKGDVLSGSFNNQNKYDLIFSYSSLYYIKEIDFVIAKISKLLKPGGIAVLEFGNKNSIEHYWSKYKYDVPQFNISKLLIKKMFKENNLKIIEDQYYQLIPEFFKKNVKVNNFLLKPFAFRIVMVVQK